MDLIIWGKYEANIFLLCFIFYNRKRLIAHIAFMTIGFIHMIMMLQVRGKGGRKYYSLHSWIGIGIAIAYGLQWFRNFFHTFRALYLSLILEYLNRYENEQKCILASSAISEFRFSWALFLWV